MAALSDDGYRVVGPTVRDGAITLAELSGADDLPYGWGVAPGPGSYRLVRRPDRAAFGYVAAPQSAKTYLHQARSLLWRGRRGEADGRAQEAGRGRRAGEGRTDEAPRQALIGLRPCDVRAIGVQDRVLGTDRGYAARRAALFVVAVNCTEPGATCFCVSAGGGPGVTGGFDLALTELVAGDQPPRYIVDVGTPAGERLLARTPHEQARPGTSPRPATRSPGRPAGWGAACPPPMCATCWRSAANRRAGTTSRRAASPAATARMVCPTCFCTTTEDTTDLTGEHAERWQTLGLLLRPGLLVPARRRRATSGASRYRQWLTHKLGTWHDQFGESGCVGCGRCIVWCPAGIDITEETAALARRRRRHDVTTL